MSVLSFISRTRPALAPPGTRLYAVGDVHGRCDLLERLLGTIQRDAQRSRAARRVIVFLGDYVDRGSQSRDVVELLCAGPPATPQWAGFRWVCLRGNHEDAMLSFLDDLSAGPSWLANGGLATIESYADTAWLDIDDLPALQVLLRRSLPDEHRAFLENLAYRHVEGDYYLVHAGVRPGVDLESQRPQDLMWIRNEFLSSDADHGKLVVHGHTIAAAPQVRPNRIGIDTGAYYSGRLTALVIEGAEKSFLST